MNRNSIYSGIWYLAGALPSRVLHLIGMLVLGLCFGQDVLGQALAPDLRIAVREDNQTAYIYHTALPAIGHGFNIYRKTVDEEAFQKVNLDPIRGVSSGTEFRAYLGTLYDDIELITDQSSDNETLTRVRSDVRTANLLSFTYPKMAQALGRLYVDTEAPINQFVTYRLEFVDALDQPTGVSLEQSVILLPQKPVPPIYLRAENTNKRVSLFWQYPVISENSDDKVIQFLVFRIDPTTNQHQQINNKIILKNDALFEYAYSFDVPATGQTEQFYVKAVDITGQQSISSEILHYETLDTTPPSALINVETKVLSGKRVQVTWKTTNDQDIAGYNLYRSPSLDDQSSYIRLNNRLLSSIETTYNDSLLVDISGSVYYYRVAALDAQGNESPYSTAAIALVKDATPPGAPANVTAVFEEGLVELNWNMADLPDDFESFIVLRHFIDPNAPIVPSRVNRTILTETSLTDLGIADAGFREGARYRYEVLGVDKAGNQSPSSTVDIQIPDNTPPSPPNGVESIVNNSSRIAVFWNPSSSTDIMSYLVYRRESGSASVQVTPISTPRYKFLDDSVKPGVTYEYWVTAADLAGNESVPSEITSVFMQDTVAPRNVRNVQVTAASDSESHIKWEPVPSRDLAGYKVYRSFSMTGTFEPLFDNLITTNQWTDENAAEDAWYKVFAVDTSGNMSPPSNPTRVFNPLNDAN